MLPSKFDLSHSGAPARGVMALQRGLRQIVHKLVTVALFWCVLPGAAHTQSQQGPITVGKSKLRITTGNSFEQLRFRGEPVAEGAKITLIDRAAIETGDAAIIAVTPGGSACKGGVVVLTAKTGEEARFDRRLIDECDGFEAIRTKSGFLLIGRPAPAVTGAVWQVEPSSGLRLVGTLAFAPEPGTGFEDLKQDGASPLALLSNQAVWRLFLALIGAEQRGYAYALAYPGPVLTPQNSSLIAVTGCPAPNACARPSGLLIADRKARAVYLAMRLASGEIKLRPDGKSWPNEARQVLTLWSGRKD